MTKTLIEKELNNLGVYEVIYLEYNDITKEIDLEILLDFNEIINEKGTLLNHLINICSFDLDYYIHNVGKETKRYIFKYKNSNISFDESKTSIHGYIFLIIEKFFKDFFRNICKI